MTELILALGTAILAVLVLNPFNVFMPGMLAMLILAALFVIFCIFAVYIVSEKAGDEREEAHRASAGRAAFLVGAGVLVAGIIIEDLAHALDPWLVIALIGMILAKIVARSYVDKRM
jgi:hypothetical protein